MSIFINHNIYILFVLQRKNIELFENNLVEYTNFSLTAYIFKITLNSLLSECVFFFVYENKYSTVVFEFIC
jgi:hypothetical protein